MTSISSSYQPVSPRDRLQDILTSDIASGSIVSSDKDALASALDSIDSSLSSQRSSGSSGARPDPSELKAKISSLIGDQVSSGKLTEEQGKELQSVFDSFQSQGPGGAGGAQGAGGPPPGPPPGVDSDGDDDSSSSTSSSSSANDPATLLKQLLAALKDGNSTTSTYGADGSSSASSLSLLLDYTA